MKNISNSKKPNENATCPLSENFFTNLSEEEILEMSAIEEMQSELAPLIRKFCKKYPFRLVKEALKFKYNTLINRNPDV